jgi:hypothetical protein
LIASQSKRDQFYGGFLILQWKVAPSIIESQSGSPFEALPTKRTLKYFPANNCTPIIAKISQNIKQTKSTLKMDGIACTNALTTT